jgi:hypothetical protein
LSGARGCGGGSFERPGLPLWQFFPLACMRCWLLIVWHKTESITVRSANAICVVATIGAKAS